MGHAHPSVPGMGQDLQPETRLPERVTTTVELDEGKWLLLGAVRENEPVCFPPFAAVTLPLADLWV